MTEPIDSAGEEARAEELGAFNRIAEALRSLPPDARGRVLATIGVFFQVNTSQGSPVLTGLKGVDRGPGLASFSEDRSLSPKEFMLGKKPLTDVERIACLAYYLTNYRSTPHFKTLDLSKLNTEAAQIKFSNAAQAVDNASKAGILVQATKGAKQISALGELYVQALPDRAAAKAAIIEGRPKRGRPRGTSSKSKNSDDE